jgi:hypothetical protein
LRIRDVLTSRSDHNNFLRLQGLMPKSIKKYADLFRPPFGSYDDIGVHYRSLAASDTPCETEKNSFSDGRKREPIRGLDQAGGKRSTRYGPRHHYIVTFQLFAVKTRTIAQFGQVGPPPAQGADVPPSTIAFDETHRP